MYAVLGDIEFDLITYFNGFESEFSAEYAEHKLIEGKPRLQYVGDNLDEIEIRLSFHAAFCNPETELARLKAALDSHQALALVMGNGDYKGWFVITRVKAESKSTDKNANTVALEASVSLREFIGDPANPLPPPAIRTDLDPVAAVSDPAAEVTPAGGVMDSVRQCVGCAKQATAAIGTAAAVVASVKAIKDNPVAALTYLPDLSRQIGVASGALGDLVPAAADIAGEMPGAADILTAANAALSSVKGAANAAQGISLDNLEGSVGMIEGAIRTADRAMDSVSPQVSRLAANVATRSV